MFLLESLCHLFECASVISGRPFHCRRLMLASHAHTLTHTHTHIAHTYAAQVEVKMFSATGWDLHERVGKPPCVKSSGDEVRGFCARTLCRVHPRNRHARDCMRAISCRFFCELSMSARSVECSLPGLLTTEHMSTLCLSIKTENFTTRSPNSFANSSHIPRSLRLFAASSLTTTCRP